MKIQLFIIFTYSYLQACQKEAYQKIFSLNESISLQEQKIVDKLKRVCSNIDADTTTCLPQNLQNELVDKFEILIEQYEENFKKLERLGKNFSSVIEKQYPNRYQNLLPHCDPAMTTVYGDNYFNIDLITLINDKEDLRGNIDKYLRKTRKLYEDLVQYKGNLLCDLVKNKNMNLEKVDYYQQDPILLINNSYKKKRIDLLKEAYSAGAFFSFFFQFSIFGACTDYDLFLKHNSFPFNMYSNHRTGYYQFLDQMKQCINLEESNKLEYTQEQLQNLSDEEKDNIEICNQYLNYMNPQSPFVVFQNLWKHIDTLNELFDAQLNYFSHNDYDDIKNNDFGGYLQSEKFDFQTGNQNQQYYEQKQTKKFDIRQSIVASQIYAPKVGDILRESIAGGNNTEEKPLKKQQLGEYYQEIQDYSLEVFLTPFEQQQSYIIVQYTEGGLDITKSVFKKNEFKESSNIIVKGFKNFFNFI